MKLNVLVTGATGYIGGRLVPRLLEEGYRVRCFVRDPRKLACRTWATHPRLEIIAGSVDNAREVEGAMRGCDVAYYLIHSMVSSGEEYREKDRKRALVFAQAARAAGLSRIIYLGGLGEMGSDLSEHLTSRREVEQALAFTGVPVTVFRAAMIIGSGSASFEILRYLVERLPVLITPKWVATECQPIAVRNVLNYLVDCLKVPETAGKTLDIGGPEIMSYRKILGLMSDALGLRRRRILPLPILSPHLSSLWIHLLTPVSKEIARPLAEGLRNRVVCRNNEALRLMPQELLTIRQAMDLALGRVKISEVDTAWSDAGPIPGDPDWSGGLVFRDERRVEIRASPQQVFRAICRIGGGHGYYAADALWQIRGWMDRLVGGPGLRRGRKNKTRLHAGEALDFWRVTEVIPDVKLVLRAEMKLPGVALLSFEIHPGKRAGKVELVQVAQYKPHGLAGLAYWAAVTPFHGFVFQGMLGGIKRLAEETPGRLISARIGVKQAP